MFENNYFNLVSDIETYIGQTTIQQDLESNTAYQVTSQTSNNANSESKLQLPKLNLPTFNGAYDQWLPFYDTFNTLIHLNKSLSDIQKFHYLRSSLKGDAAQVIHSLELSTANYDVAWKLVKERYENKRLIVQTHVKALFYLPIVVKESHVLLRQLLDSVQRHLRALKSLNQPTDSWDTLIIHLITVKLDTSTKREWETSIKTNELPSMENIVKFLTHRCQLLESLDTGKLGKIFQPVTNQITRTRKVGEVSTVHLSTWNPLCSFCKEAHWLFKCNGFLQLSTSSRIAEIKRLKLCLNCLRPNHCSYQYKSSACKLCNKKHNTLLHLSDAEESKPIPDQAITGSYSCLNASQTILSTAMVQIINNQMSHSTRALLDSASQSCFITESLCERLKLKKTKINLPITGISQTMMRVQYLVQATLKSTFNAFQSNLSFLVVDKITQNLPSFTLDTSDWEIPQSIKLADPSFNLSSPVDILLGTEIFWDLLCIGQIKLGKNQPILQKTQLGWIVAGKLNTKFGKKNTPTCSFSIQSLQGQMCKFWEVEECEASGSHRALTQEEAMCEAHYTTNTVRTTEGRFVVKMPLRDNYSALGDSREQAMKRLLTLERKFQHQPQLKQQYVQFLKEYESLGHMEMVSDQQAIANDHLCYYLPHHAVLRDTSITTKLRVVFDGSATTSSGISLNDVMMVGPTIQQNLFHIVTRFRTHKYVLTADISKMYRQVWIHPNHTDLQRILWRSDSSMPVMTFRLKTVTYGTASAPYLAIRSLYQLAVEAEKTHPLAAEIVKKDFYVDDLLTGANSITQVMQIKDELVQLLGEGGFQLNKWASNCEAITANLAEQASVLILDRTNDIKTLGLFWNSSTDCFHYQIKTSASQKITKRNILSIISQIFDPLGLIGPVILKAKIIMQRLWSLKLGWDESLPIEIHTSWLQYSTQFQLLEQISVPRLIISPQATTLQIHGFCDASESAYGTCIYIRSTNSSHQHFISLVCSKSRVAPLKKISLPRLELLAALLLAKLLKEVVEALNLTIEDTYFWSDSTIVLSWLSRPSADWKTFVANRVTQIQSLTNTQNWRHISTYENPADLISRGVSPGALLKSHLWWNGPTWLTRDSEEWPQSIWPTQSNGEEIEKRAECQTFVLYSNNDIMERFSSFAKLVGVIAFCRRFVSNTLQSHDNRQFGELTTIERQLAIKTLVGMVQRIAFSQELKDLKSNRNIRKTSSVLRLSPFLDSEGLIRVGGRLINASIAYEQKHPLLLPGKHPFTKLLIRHEHLKQLHAGPGALLATLRLKFWPVAGGSVVRNIVRQCLICARLRMVQSPYLMGNLPSFRVDPSRPFTNTGIDLCGPFFIKEFRKRSRIVIKTYVVVFICFATKAVHLELVADLTTDAFLGAFRRFVSRRGRCLNVYSDNATNFVGAKNELLELSQLFASEHHQAKVQRELSGDGINWHFIPPGSPHFGGLWEAGVKSTKFHLKRVIGLSTLTFEEMNTLLAQVEACLNSRPLTPLSTDPLDLNALTPGHFLVGSPLIGLPDTDYRSTPLNRLSRWQHIQQMLQHFWARWSREYLGHLQQRTKWNIEKANVSKGMLVVMKEASSPPLKWKLGRITEIYPGKDGVVRVVTVRTIVGHFKRSVTQICILPVEVTSNDN